MSNGEEVKDSYDGAPRHTAAAVHCMLRMCAERDRVARCPAKLLLLALTQAGRRRRPCALRRMRLSVVLSSAALRSSLQPPPAPHHLSPSHPAQASCGSTCPRSRRSSSSRSTSRILNYRQGAFLVGFFFRIGWLSSGAQLMLQQSIHHGRTATVTIDRCMVVLPGCVGRVVVVSRHDGRQSDSTGDDDRS